jgi:hypothetical protein
VTDLPATLAARLVDAWVHAIAWCWDRIDAS